MMEARFRANDAREILDIVEDLSHVRTGAELMNRLLQHMARIIPSVSASFNWFSQGRLEYLVHPPFPPEDTPHFERIMLRNWQQNPLVEHFRVTKDTRALRWRDLGDEDQWRRSLLYREFYLPLGIQDQLGLRMPSPPGVAAALVVNGDHPFDNHDVAVLARLGRPVFAQLSALADRNAMQVALRGLGWSTLLVDDDGRVMGDTSAAIAHLVCNDELVVAQLRAAVLESSTADSPFSPQVIDTPTGSFRMIVTRNALSPHSLFVSAVEDDNAEPLSVLEGTGLSHREIEVAMLMRDGASNAVIARELGVAVGTVKKHLERVFHLLGVRNRTAAADALRRLFESKTQE